MSIARKVQSVERLYGKLQIEIDQFRAETHLHCMVGCGKCCTKPDVEASPLEFLPWAFHIFLEGKALDLLDTLKTSPASICHLYRPMSTADIGKGSCGEYGYRGLICRLFGYGAARDKMGQLRLVACKIIKENQQTDFKNAEEALNAGLSVPVFSDYYRKLGQIDFRLGNTIVPINLALQMALEEILFHYAYRPFPRKFKKSA